MTKLARPGPPRIAWLEPFSEPIGGSCRATAQGSWRCRAGRCHGRAALAAAMSARHEGAAHGRGQAVPCGVRHDRGTQAGLRQSQGIRVQGRRAGLGGAGSARGGDGSARSVGRRPPVMPLRDTGTKVRYGANASGVSAPLSDRLWTTGAESGSQVPLPGPQESFDGGRNGAPGALEKPMAGPCHAGGARRAVERSVSPPGRTANRLAPYPPAPMLGI